MAASRAHDFSGIINKIAVGKRGINIDTALRETHVFGASKGFRICLQADYDLEETRMRISEDLQHVENLAA